MGVITSTCRLLTCWGSQLHRQVNLTHEGGLSSCVEVIKLPQKLIKSLKFITLIVLTQPISAFLKLSIYLISDLLFASFVLFTPIKNWIKFKHIHNSVVYPLTDSARPTFRHYSTSLLFFLLYLCTSEYSSCLSNVLTLVDIFEVSYMQQLQYRYPL